MGREPFSKRIVCCVGRRRETRTQVGKIVRAYLKNVWVCLEQSLVELYPSRHNSAHGGMVTPGELMVSCRHDGHKMSRDQCGVGDGSGGSGFNASLHCRVQAYSVDGGRTFGNFTGKGRWLPDTPVKGGLARWPQRRALLFSNPDVQLEPCPLHCINDYGRCDATQGQGCFSQRNDVTIFASTDNGYSWPHKILVWPWNGHSYSDVVVLPDGRPAALISTSNSTRVVGVAGSVTLAIVDDPDTLLPPLSTTGSM